MQLSTLVRHLTHSKAHLVLVRKHVQNQLLDPYTLQSACNQITCSGHRAHAISYEHSAIFTRDEMVLICIPAKCGNCPASTTTSSHDEADARD